MNISASNSMNFKGAVVIPSYFPPNEITGTLRKAAVDQLGNEILDHGLNIPVNDKNNKSMALSIWGGDHDKFVQCVENNKNEIHANTPFSAQKVLANALVKVKTFPQALTLEEAKKFVSNPENIKQNIITDDDLNEALEIVKKENS